MPAEQMSLGGFESGRIEDRLFLGILPDGKTADRIAALAQDLRVKHGLRGQPLGADRLHVTLFHLGDHVELHQDIVAAAILAAQRFNFPNFDVRFDSASSFKGRQSNRPFVLRCPADEGSLYTFQRELGSHLIGAGLGEYVKTAFTPHVTLLYDDQIIASESIEAIAWNVREFVLIHSLLGQHKHVPIERWALR